MNILLLQEVAVTVASTNGNDAFGSISVFGLPLELFILLVVVVDIVIACVIIVVATKKLQPKSREEEVEEAVQEIELTEIKGIGSRKAEELKAVGVNTVLDLAKSSAKDLSEKPASQRKPFRDGLWKQTERMNTWKFYLSCGDKITRPEKQ